MTIDSGWNKIIKNAIPDAFYDTLKSTQKPTTVFIDGQIKLMCSSSIQHWNVFFKVQFLSAIEQAFATGATTVVLGFDDYSAVPEAKNMTQLKRSRHVPAMNFAQDDDLPPIMPENWAAAMRNRTFKVKVIQMIISNIRLHYNQSVNDLHSKHRTVVVDFVGQPDVIGLPIVLPDLSGKRGECDIKAFAWSCYGPLLIVSTDGDFVAISLLQLERMLLETQQRHQIYLLRMKTNVEPTGKHPREKSTKREYEYVDMLGVLSWVNKQMQSVGVVGSPAQNFAAMIASTGCDFAMNLPNIGPTKLWQARSHFRNLNMATPEGLMIALTRVYHSIYQRKIVTVAGLANNHHDFDSSTHLYQQVATLIKGSTNISTTLQARTWDLPRMQAHVKNAFWTLLYWSLLQNYPDPMSAEFGFVRNGKYVTFEGAV